MTPRAPFERFAERAPADALSAELRDRLRADGRAWSTQADALLAVLYCAWSPVWLDLCPETQESARAARAWRGLPLAEDTRARIWSEARPGCEAALRAIRASGGIDALAACYGRAQDRDRSAYYPPVWRLTVAAAALAAVRGADLGPVSEAARRVWAGL